MYLTDLAEEIRNCIPKDRVPDGDSDALFLSYAVLLRARGDQVTESDVHDAWAAWIHISNPGHAALVPYADLADDVAEEDRVFAEAIRTVARRYGIEPSEREFLDTLFPNGHPATLEDLSGVLDLYKMMVSSSESLVNRRQGVNTFFLTMNGAILTASGLIVQNASDARLGSWAVLVLSVTGGLLSLAWRSLIRSFGQLNTGKFKVINTIEQYLDASVYAAEWVALGRGKNPDVYRSFTSREIWVPNALVGVYLVAGLASVVIGVGWLSVGTGG